jgi:protein TonB
MKKNLLLIIAILATSFLFAQAPISVTKGIPVPYESVDNKPIFPGGNNEFIKFVGKNFKVPDVEDISGLVKVTFIIEINGTISEIKVLQDVGHGSAEEIKRVLKLSPQWTPGDQLGKPVRVLFTLPVTIRN